MTIQNPELESFSNFDINQQRENSYLTRNVENCFKINQTSQILKEVSKKSSSSSTKFLYKSKIPVLSRRYFNLDDFRANETIPIRDSSQNFKNIKHSTMSGQVNSHDSIVNTQLMNNRTALVSNKFSRSKSMNHQKLCTNQNSNFSSFQSATLFDSLSTSNSSFKISQNSFIERTKFLLKKIKQIEMRYSADLFYQYLNDNFKQTECDVICVKFLESQLFNNDLTQKNCSLPRSSSMMRSTPVDRLEGTPPIGFIYDLNGRNLLQEQETIDYSGNPLKSWLKCIEKIRKIYTILENDIINELISIELETLPNERLLSRSIEFSNIDFPENHFQRLQKHNEKLLDMNDSLCRLIRENSTCNYELLSPQSTLAKKYENVKNFDYVLRLVPDIILKMRTILKLSVKCYDLCKKINDDLSSRPVEKLRLSELKKSRSIQHPVQNFKSKELDFKCKTKSDEFEQYKIFENRLHFDMPKKENNRKITEYRLNNMNPELKKLDSFIKETDCSSIFTDEEKLDFSSKNSSQKRIEALKEELKLVQKRINSTTKSIDDFKSYLNTLLERAERCGRLKTQIQSDKKLIRKTENSLMHYINKKKKSATFILTSKYDYSDDIELNKQLDFLRYRLKLNSQDFSIEKTCAPEINFVIFDIQQRLAKEKSELDNLQRYMKFIESKLGYQKQKSKILINSRTACIRRHSRPVDLPPLPNSTQIVNKNYLEYNHEI